MDPARWREVSRVFDAAAPLPPADRAAALTAMCAGDPDLLRHVTRLLRLDARATETAFLALSPARLRPPPWRTTRAREERPQAAAPRAPHG